MVQNTNKPKSAKHESATSVSKLNGIAWWHLGIIVAAALICYLQAVDYNFVYDDGTQIVENPRIRSFINIGKAFSENVWAFKSPGYFSNYYRPLQTLVYMLGYAMGALSPVPYHALSIGMHVLCCLAAYWVYMELSGIASIAFWGALLFAVHPMHTESVTWIAGVTDVGCGLFYFVALGSYLRSLNDAKKRIQWQAIACIAFMLALLFKEMALTLPLVVFFMDCACGDKIGNTPLKRRLQRLLPLVIVLLMYLALRISALGVFARSKIKLPISFADRVGTMLYLLGRYVQDLVAPVAQNAYQVFLPFSKLYPGEWLLPYLLMAGWLALIWIFRLRERNISFFALFVIVTLIPVLNLGGVGHNIFTERYLYIPSLGFCFLVAACIRRFLGVRKWTLLLQGCIVLIFTLLTMQRNPIWKDDKIFYRETLSASPSAVPLWNNLGAVYLRENNLSAARLAFQSALNPQGRGYIHNTQEQTGALVGLSVIEIAQGDFPAAATHAQKALELIPDLPEGCLALGSALARLGKYAPAEGLLRKALSSLPENPSAHYYLGNVLFARNNLTEAEKELHTAMQLDPAYAAPRMALASLLIRANRAAEARLLLENVLAGEPGNQQARQLLGQIHASSAP